MGTEKGSPRLSKSQPCAKTELSKVADAPGAEAPSKSGGSLPGRRGQGMGAGANTGCHPAARGMGATAASVTSAARAWPCVVAWGGHFMIATCSSGRGNSHLSLLELAVMCSAP